MRILPRVEVRRPGANCVPITESLRNLYRIARFQRP